MTHCAKPLPEYLTLGQLAELFDTSLHKVKYAIDTYRVQPVMRVGITRVWGQDSIPLIRSALARIGSSKGGRR